MKYTHRSKSTERPARVLGHVDPEKPELFFVALEPVAGCREDYASYTAKQFEDWYEEMPDEWLDCPIDTPVWVRSTGEYWRRRHFAGVDPGTGRPRAWTDGHTSHSVDDDELFCSWDECRRTDPALN